jgi:uridine kinase
MLAEAVAQLATTLIAQSRRGAVTVVALDGGGGAGKSTLAELIKRTLSTVSIVGLDDFYRPLHGDARAEADPKYTYLKYLELERVRREALVPLRTGTIARYQPRDWKSAELRGWVEVAPNPIVILEGVYSSCPELRDLIDLAIFVHTPRAIRQARLLARRQDDTAWIERWMAVEDWYLSNIRPADTADLVVAGS